MGNMKKTIRIVFSSLYLPLIKEGKFRNDINKINKFVGNPLKWNRRFFYVALSSSVWYAAANAYCQRLNW